jgi:hypothetical protein
VALAISPFALLGGDWLAVVLAIIAVTGIPIGAAMGFLAGPRVVRTRHPVRFGILLALISALVGILGYGILGALGEARGATPWQVLAAIPSYAFFYVFALPLALPVTGLCAGLAVLTMRWAAQTRRRSWIVIVPTVLGLIIIVSATALVGMTRPVDPENPGQGSGIVRQSNEVRLTYVAVNRSGRDLGLAIGSRLADEEVGGSWGYLGTCASGDEPVQSDWRIQITGPDPDVPSALDHIIARGADFPGTSPRVLIVIEADGKARVEPLGNTPPDAC